MFVYLYLSPTADVNANRATEAANNSVATRKGALVFVEEKVSILMERDGGVSSSLYFSFYIS